MFKQIIILIGKSGSGKGTQAEFLQKKFSFDYISSGNLLRERAKKNDFTGKKLNNVLVKGLLAPATVVSKIWLDKVEELKNKKDLKGIIMDGNPRRIVEAYLIDEAFSWYDWNKEVKAIYIDISDKEAIWRLTKRRICKDKKCGEIIPYIGEFRKMKKCPKCGGELIQRSDDTVKSAKERLSWFKKEVYPIIEYYKKTGRLIRVDGEQSMENVFSDILKSLK